MGKERPILFSRPMVRAIREDRKGQTRRLKGLDIINKTPNRYALKAVAHDDPEPPYAVFIDPATGGEEWVRCPYGKPGDRLWVKETHWFEPFGDWPYVFFPDGGKLIVPREHAGEAIAKYRDVPHTRPSIHMFRWASRILLEVTAVRVERLQDISEEDAIAEGVTFDGTYWNGGPHRIKGTSKVFPTAVQAYRDLWEHINGQGSWEANPWIWVVEFKRVEGR